MGRWPSFAAALAAALLVSSLGCGSNEPPPVVTNVDQPLPPATSPTSRPRVVILGDSLTAGLGLVHDQAFPSILQQKADAAGLGFEMVNAGVSGDTSAGGLRRLDWSLAGDVRLLVIALGANDGLRGLPVEDLRRNLSQIIDRARSKGIAVVLAGMEAPPNFGRAYTDDFRNVYASLAREHSIPLIPFLLEDVAGVDAMNQADGIHPTAAGAQIVAANVWNVIEPILREQTHRKT